LKFTKAGSAATLPQQEKNNSADVQRGGFILRGDVPSVSSSRWPKASRRARHRRCMFELQQRRLCLRQNLGVGLWRLALACFFAKIFAKMVLIWTAQNATKMVLFWGGLASALKPRKLSRKERKFRKKNAKILRKLAKKWRNRSALIV
jgi:hypothetical protein